MSSLAFARWFLFSTWAIPAAGCSSTTNSTTDLGDDNYTLVELWNGGEAVDINDRGQVVGYGSVIGSGAPPALLWEDGVLRELGRFEDAVPNVAVNELGQVLVVHRFGCCLANSFLWENNVLKKLDVVPDFVKGEALNNVGQIVGTFRTGDPGPSGFLSHGFLWENEVLQNLGSLGDGYSTAVAINDFGQVVGESETASGEIHAFLWNDGVMQDLGTLGGTYSSVGGPVLDVWKWPGRSINASGQVVGLSTTTEVGECPAVVFPRPPPLGDCHALGGAPRSFSFAIDINNRGQIVGPGAVMWVRE